MTIEGFEFIIILVNCPEEIVFDRRLLLESLGFQGVKSFSLLLFYIRLEFFIDDTDHIDYFSILINKFVFFEGQQAIYKSLEMPSLLLFEQLP